MPSGEADGVHEQEEWAMADLKVKGTMFVDQVKMIRANKTLDWSKYLDSADWEIINKRILPSEWYPLDIYVKCAMAVFHVLGQENLDLVRFRGRMRGKELFETVYKALVIPNDPMASLSRFVVAYSQLFNFSSLKLEPAGKNHAKLHHDNKYTMHVNKPYCFQLMGHLDVLVEIAGGKNIKIKLTATQWEGAPQTIFDITWE
jgi:uncharacterized protein (TIGR02265 family)